MNKHLNEAAIYQLDSRIKEFVARLNYSERSALKRKLSAQIMRFFNVHNELDITSEADHDAFKTLAATLRFLTPQSCKIPTNGIAYFSEPAWLSRELLSLLQGEAILRRNAPLDRIDHFLGCGGEIADSIAVSDSVIAFVESYVGKVIPTGIASYLYYDRPGAGIRPHVDTEIFSINLMIMLRHEYSGEMPPSATVVFPAGCQPEHYRLQVGQAMIMYGSSIIHTRTIINETEDIHLLTIGFNPDEGSDV